MKCRDCGQVLKFCGGQRAAEGESVACRVEVLGYHRIAVAENGKSSVTAIGYSAVIRNMYDCTESIGGVLFRYIAFLL